MATTKRKRHDGGPAFPNSPPLPMSEGDRKGKAGMSLRDFFAAQALPAIVAAAYRGEARPRDESRPVSDSLVAEQAYAFADCMLAERNREPS